MWTYAVLEALDQPMQKGCVTFSIRRRCSGGAAAACLLIGGNGAQVIGPVAVLSAGSRSGTFARAVRRECDGGVLVLCRALTHDDELLDRDLRAKTLPVGLCCTRRTRRTADPDGPDRDSSRTVSPFICCRSISVQLHQLLRGPEVLLEVGRPMVKTRPAVVAHRRGRGSSFRARSGGLPYAQLDLRGVLVRACRSRPRPGTARRTCPPGPPGGSGGPPA